MARVQVTEYETVERTEYKNKCDECKQIVNDDAIHSIHYFDGYYTGGPLEGRNPTEKKYLCEDCVGLKRALKIRETEEKLQARWEGFRGTVDFYLPVIASSLTFLTCWAVVVMYKYMNPNGEPMILDLLISPILFWVLVLVTGFIFAFFFHNLDA